MSKSSRTKSRSLSTTHSSIPLAASRTTPSKHLSPSFMILLVILLILALRLTLSETPVEAFSQLIERIVPAPNAPPPTPEPGPAAIIGLSLLTAILAGLATICTRLTRQAWLLLALITAILALSTASTFHAANHFVALVGTFDLAMATLGGWSIMLLANTESRRRFIIAALLAVLAVWITKGFYQRYVDIPDTIRFYQEHKQEIWHQHGWSPGDYHIALFEGRMNSKEVTGFSSFSNVTAQGLIALSLLALALLLVVSNVKVLWVGEYVSTIRVLALLIASIRIRALRKLYGKEDIPVPVVGAVCLSLVVIAAAIVLFLTESKGGCAAFALFAILLCLGLHFRDLLTRHWRRAVLTMLLVWITGTIGVIAYGMHFDTLPTRSLMFRWHYWTASEPIMRSSPLRGVGLNNYGEYYLQYKRPTSPEDVKDPHSFFVRIASELGLPAVFLFAILLITWFYYAARSLALSPSSPGIAIPGPALSHSNYALITALAFCLLWWLARLFLNERPDIALSLILSLIYTITAFAGFMLADATCRHAPGALRAASFALLLGALGMLLYDQVNTGLVTGPLPMFFWACLGLTSAEGCHASIAQCATEACRNGSNSQFNPGRRSIGTGSLIIFTAAILTIGIWIPLLQDTLPWDPRPLEIAFIQQLAQRDPKLAQEELQLLDRALQLDPRAIELLNHRIMLKSSQGLSVQQNIRDILALDRCDVQLRITLAQLPSDWPASERIAALQQALDLDQQLEKREPKRLTEEQRQAVKALITTLQANK